MKNALSRALSGTAFPTRLGTLLALLLLAVLVLLWRLFDLQYLSRETWLEKGDAHSRQDLPIAAQRGTISDRNGVALAVSTTLIRLEAGKDLWAEARPLKRDERRRQRNLAKALGQEPDAFVQRVQSEGARARWAELAAVLGEAPEALRARLEQVKSHSFYILAKGLSPEQGAAVHALRIPGIKTREYYRRYYPAADVTAQLVGRSDGDDRGQEGLELAFDEWLSGEPGKRLVVQDRRGRLLEELDEVQPAQRGRDLTLSIDLRLQNLASRELALALEQSHAKAGSLVLLDVHSGEVLAMASQPSFNPNDRSSYRAEPARNRALLDNLEPGSTVKPLTIIAALQSGRWKPEDTVDLGRYRSLKIDRFRAIEDVAKSGPQLADLTQILVKSSNVGISKIALDIGPDPIRELMYRFGFSQGTGLGFPGEQVGKLPAFTHWSKRSIANLGYGYGVEVTAVQLAHAYATLAADGLMRPLSLLKLEHLPQAEQVIDQNIAKTVRGMLQQVVAAADGAVRARVAGYQVAGKSGTVDKTQEGSKGYGNGSRAFFAGFAPASAPRFALVVVLDEPEKKKGLKVHYGGFAAAPVFSRVMEGTLRLMQVPMDAPAATLAGEPH